MGVLTRIISLILLLSISVSTSAEPFGAFSAPIKAEWLEDGRKMRLLEDITYTDPNGMNWLAREGDVVDGASIPGWLWSVVGSPFAGKYRDASVIHDVACQERTRTWEVVHLSFYYAMRASGVPEKNARVMYAAVYHFGPRWPVETIQSNSSIFGGIFGGFYGSKEPAPPAPSSLAREDFDRLQRAIESGAVTSLEGIREFQ